MKRITWLILALVTLIQLSGCSKYTRVGENPESIKTTLKIGDKVKIRTRDGNTLFLRVTAVSPDGITGSLIYTSKDADPDTETSANRKVTVAYKDIEYLERGKFSAGKTAVSAAGVGAGLFMFVIAIPFLMAIL